MFNQFSVKWPWYTTCSRGGNNAMMIRSAFQGGANSPPYSPAKGPGKVYASVAEMKRSRAKVSAAVQHVDLSMKIFQNIYGYVYIS